MRTAFLVGIVVGLAACADPVAPFLGTYAVTGTVAYSDGNSYPVSSTETVTRSSTPDKIVVPTEQCDATATVTDSQSFSIDNQTCPPFNYTDTACGPCSIVLTFVKGTGALAGNSLTVNANGSYAQTCGNGCNPQPGTFTLTYSGTKP